VAETTACRSCGSAAIERFLDLGVTPLADALVSADNLDGPQARFPLRVSFCPDCSLVQVTDERIDSEAGDRIEWIADFYDERYAHLNADVIVCRHTLEHIQPTGAGQRAVIWGSGSKGVSYLTNLGITEEIRFAVDINPFKHGKFMAVVGQLIVPPEFLRDFLPDLVIAMTPVYLEEIQRDLDALGITAKLVAV
jgi:hypothetical protein